MCGRFTFTSDTDLLQQFFLDFEIPSDMSPRYNITPTQDIAVVTNEQDQSGNNVDKKKVQFYQWGLIPSWAKDAKIGNKLINARSETLAEKPSFRSAYKRRRCLILADGYYEWQHKPGDKQKQPMYIRFKSKNPFAFAGLWEEWKPNWLQTPLRSCTIITCPPNPLLESVHHRMPVILPPEDYQQWVEPDEKTTEQLQSLLVPYHGEEMEVYAVSKYVNRPVNDSPQCIVPMEETNGSGKQEITGTLF